MSLRELCTDSMKYGWFLFVFSGLHILFEKLLGWETMSAAGTMLSAMSMISIGLVYYAIVGARSKA
jgi:hypothetical protein